MVRDETVIDVFMELVEKIRTVRMLVEHTDMLPVKGFTCYGMANSKVRIIGFSPNIQPALITVRNAVVFEKHQYHCL